RRASLTHHLLQSIQRKWGHSPVNGSANRCCHVGETFASSLSLSRDRSNGFVSPRPHWSLQSYSESNTHLFSVAAHINEDVIVRNSILRVSVFIGLIAIVLRNLWHIKFGNSSCQI
ncbi:unnamed protein product, partial [Musa hybrid cultivar]